MIRIAIARQPRSMSVIEQGLLGAAALGLVTLLSLPAARGMSEILGWMPMWLLAMPLVAWCALRSTRCLPPPPAHDAMAPAVHWRSTGIAAARRRGAGRARRSLPRVA